MDTVKDKIIWIIGASSGIGKALAHELHKNGAKLALSARSEDKLIALQQKLGSEHKAYPLDISNDKKAEETAQQIAKDFGRIDSVIFLAASYNPGEQDLSPERVRKALDVNIGGAFYLLHAIRPIYRNQGGGQFVMTASVAGYRGLPGGQPYCATKAALINLAESLKIDLADEHIDVKVICPGFVETPLTDKNDFEMPMMIQPDEAAQHIAKGIASSAFEIHFPKKFTYIMKIIEALPRWAYFPLIKKMVKK